MSDDLSQGLPPIPGDRDPIKISSGDLPPEGGPHGQAGWAQSFGPQGGWSQGAGYGTRGFAAYCRSCGAPLPANATACARCGQGVVAHDAAVAEALTLAASLKSPGLAAVLSLIVPGAGQVYAGHVARGVAFFVAAVISWVLIFFLIGFILLPVVAIGGAVDAHQLVQKANQRIVAQRGITGWPGAGPYGP